MQAINLDTNATMPLRARAFEIMRKWLESSVGNPSSAHHAGRKARQALEDARERVAFMLGASPQEVVFTSGATEGNNLAILGKQKSVPGRILASRIEHPCVLEPLNFLVTKGFGIDWLPVNSSGVVNLESLLECLKPGTTIATLMLANHETGAVQPVRELKSRLPETILLHCDAAQAVGKIPIDFQALGAATLSASGHKFGGPVGVGILLVRKGTPIDPLFFGGHQEGGRRPGTQPVALVLGFVAALECAIAEMQQAHKHLESLRAKLWELLFAQTSPVILNGPGIGSTNVLPGTLNVSFPGCRADVLLMSLDLVGVACSTGSACSSGSLLPSPVLAAMGVPEEVLRSAIRFSFSSSTSLEEILIAASRIAECVSRLRR